MLNPFCWQLFLVLIFILQNRMLLFWKFYTFIAKSVHFKENEKRRVKSSLWILRKTHTQRWIFTKFKKFCKTGKFGHFLVYIPNITTLKLIEIFSKKKHFTTFSNMATRFSQLIFLGQIPIKEKKTLSKLVPNFFSYFANRYTDIFLRLLSLSSVQHGAPTHNLWLAMLSDWNQSHKTIRTSYTSLI